MSHIKRLTKEVGNYMKSFTTTAINDNEYIICLEDNGAYLYVNMSNITKLKALVIGPSTTSYEDGFYVFDINVVDTYPFEPPKVTHLTTDGRIRINPNLYGEGKVCLSILGTWAGPAWSSLMNVSIILNYLRMIMNEDPLRNEPGFSNPKTHLDKAQEYNEYVDHENMRFSILTVHKNNLFPVFKTVIDELFEKKKDKIIKKILDKKIEIPKKTINNNYGQTVTLDWNKMMELI